MTSVGVNPKRFRFATVNSDPSTWQMAYELSLPEMASFVYGETVSANMDSTIRLRQTWRMCALWRPGKESNGYTNLVLASDLTLIDPMRLSVMEIFNMGRQHKCWHPNLTELYEIVEQAVAADTFTFDHYSDSSETAENVKAVDEDDE